ncbi:hypothetical protein B0T19DRAFT_153999 [Cercophora scortea]|uniref:Uncharacterized protein n=1 Tax=Cercophora scortea TaxID=314031 RepID=A0AAE0ILS1_9PEZI|nr:hypothetical protein B0T19DRAFT_153999 [Cercophora scortea]
MIAKILLPVLAAIGSVSAQTKVTTCTVTTTTINSQADATALSSCGAIKGSVVIGEGAGENVDISGPSIITGDLAVLENTVIKTLQSTSLTAVGGAFALDKLNVVTSITFPVLDSVKNISWTSVPNLGDMSIAVTKADYVVIADTFLATLAGINLASVKTLNINNNRRLIKFDTDLATLSDNFLVQANGGGQLTINLPKLIWIANMTIANVTSFLVPSLATVNGSARFDSNYFSSFSAPNLTSTKAGDISFVGNAKLSNITVPKLSAIAGGLLIANNTALEEIDFPKLATIGGAVKLRGNFTSVDFPALDDVKGAFDISSTADVSKSCDTFQKLAPSTQGGGGQIQGTYSCTSHNDQANSDTGSGTSSGGGSSGGGDSTGTKNNTANGLSFNAAILGLAVVGGFSQALW